MSPFELDILLWYRGHCDDHPVFLENPPILDETRDFFLRNHLLEINQANPNKPTANYKLGDRGHVFIDYIERLPLPEWKMP